MSANRERQEDVSQLSLVGHGDDGDCSVAVKVWRALEREYVELSFRRAGWDVDESYDLTHEQADHLIEVLRCRPRSAAIVAAEWWVTAEPAGRPRPQ